jgi:hypothetical protein
VWKGVACALTDAFVPSSDVLTAQVGSTESAVMGKPPLSLFTSVAPVFTGLTTGWSDGCASNVADFGPQGLRSLPIPCRPPSSVVWTAIYALMGGALVVSTCLYVWSMLVGALGGKSTGDDS